jgi:hypothetical protein
MPGLATPSHLVIMDTRSPDTAAGLADATRALVRAAARGLVVLLVALGACALPALAYASPPDPSWLSGIWNAADGDDVIALVLSAVKAVGAVVVTPAWLAPRLIGHVPPRGRDALPAPLRAGIRSRAPPFAD